MLLLLPVLSAALSVPVVCNAGACLRFGVAVTLGAQGDRHPYRNRITEFSHYNLESRRESGLT